MPTREMRGIVAGIVLSDPVKYSATVLERDPKDYAQWIQKDESWGGQCVNAVYDPVSVCYLGEAV